MTLFRLTQPAVLVPLSEAKKHLKVSFSDDDSIIELCSQFAQDYIEQQTGQWLGEQSWSYKLDSFPTGRTINLDFGPLKSITSIKYLDSDGAEQTLSQSKYYFARDPHKSRIVLKPVESWPVTADGAPDAVTIEALGGYKIGANTAQGETELPPTLKKALYLLVNHFYEFRELVYTGLQLREFPAALTVTHMLSTYKRVGV